MPTPIENRFQDLLASGLNLGQAIGPETETVDGGAMRVYQFGRIYFHQRLGFPFEVHGAILDRYIELGEVASPLGYPLSDEFDDPDQLIGRMNQFESGTIRWNPIEFVTVQLAEGEPNWTTRIIVKLVDGIDPPVPDRVEVTLFSVLEEFAPIPIIVQLGTLIGGATVRKCFFSFSEQEMADIIAEARAVSPEYAPPNLNNFIEIDCPDTIDADFIAGMLNQVTGFVEYAYVAGTSVDPAVAGTPNALFATQRYLQAGPNGIGAAAAWARGADGSGIRVIDIEQGWVFTHEDLPRLVHLLDGTNVGTSRFHGLAVLGILIGVDDTRGIVGLCPECTIDVVSLATSRGGDLIDQLPDRIASTVRSVGFGGIVLLEAQHRDRRIGQLLPVESQRLEFEAIRLATARGVVVVEAAGNSGFDIDTFTDVDGKHTMNPAFAGEFKQSGAILVGASREEFPHERLGLSNFGARVDCYAWGERTATTGDPDAPDVVNIYWDPDREYRPGRFGFGGTSGASAIIAGVCTLVQDMRLRLTPSDGTSGKLGPHAMRALLGKSANGTDSFLISDKIGVMPDLSKILANEFF